MNLFVTMLLGGLWHGASWTFVLWGGYHGSLLAIERLLGKKNVLGKLPGWVQQGWTMLLVMFGWTLFRCESLTQVKRIIQAFRDLSGAQVAQLWQEWSALPFIMLIAAAFIALFVSNTWEQKWKLGWAQGIAIAILYVLSVATVLVNTSSPFLYFQF
jgi:alginate O-acetyltransferase complex protein AlgI